MNPDEENPTLNTHSAPLGHNQPGDQHRAQRALQVEWELLHSVRGRGLPAHHIQPRPARCAFDLQGFKDTDHHRS